MFLNLRTAFLVVVSGAICVSGGFFCFRNSIEVSFRSLSRTGGHHSVVPERTGSAVRTTVINRVLF